MTDTTIVTETVKLSRPLKTHDGDKTVLTLREPTAKLFFDYGEAFKVKVTIGDDGKQHIDFTFNDSIMKKYLSSMTGVDDLVLSDLRAADYVELRGRAAWMVVGVSGSNPSET
jgi:hypothetical protein